MKSKTDSPANVCYNPAAANVPPVIHGPCAETQATVYADLSLSPVLTLHKALFRQQVHAKWRTGEYTCPDGCDMFLLDTVAILSPQKATDPKEQQIQQLNYENFINVMAEMILKYGTQNSETTGGIEMISLTNTRKGKKCALYLRTNQEHQTRDHRNHSIDSQKEYLLNRASREGVEVVGVYSDAGKSGGSISGCDELQRLLNDVVSHKIDIDYVMVCELSRFGRNVKDVSDTLSILRAHGVNLLYPCDDTEIECFDSLRGSLNWDWAAFAKKVR